MVTWGALRRCVVNLAWVGAGVLILSLAFGCRPQRTSKGTLTAEVPLHLAAHLEEASVEGSELLLEQPAPVEWRFDQPREDWQAVGYDRSGERLPEVRYVEGAVRLTLVDEERPMGWDMFHGGLYVDLPDWDLTDWSQVIVRLRAEDQIGHLGLGINLDANTAHRDNPVPFESWVPEVPVIDDGSVQSYVFRLDRFGENPPDGTWRQLAVYLGAEDPATVDLLSVSIVPREADYAAAPVGVRMTERGGRYRRAIYTHGSGRISYRVRVPKAGRLYFSLGTLREDQPVAFRVSVAVPGESSTSVFDETQADPRDWATRSIDLSGFAGQTVDLTLETRAEEGTVALWGTPVLAGERHGSASSRRPNVIFYIIDGAGADFMSAYGYNRQTTPVLERLAAQGVVFERAYSNATWTKVSTASFMTSIPHSALGGYRSDTDRLPEGATTMAEQLHAAGYQTAIIVSNPYAASLSGLERGADFLHETGIEPNNSESSRLLHESFWRWRESDPAEPYWVHFQSTDIHEPFNPVAPYSGLYLDPEVRRSYEKWDPKLLPREGWRDPDVYEEHGIDLARYSYAQQGLYDEAMAHNDSKLGELVERLQERGEWENTLLIVASDHGYPAACHRLMEPLPPMWGPMFNSHETRVPLLFVWPGRISSGQRFSTPVSMMDVLPTVMELMELPVPETAMGRSLAPLLLGRSDWQPHPVILDEFNVDQETGEMEGLIEVVDGWWGASLEIGEGAANDLGFMGAETEEERPVPLLLYNLRDDPFTLHSLHEERPDLVEKYRDLLQRQWRTHQELGTTLGDGGQVVVGQEQLEALRSLGYID